jgi:hypothetical protein
MSHIYSITGHSLKKPLKPHPACSPRIVSPHNLQLTPLVMDLERFSSRLNKSQPGMYIYTCVYIYIYVHMIYIYTILGAPSSMSPRGTSSSSQGKSGLVGISNPSQAMGVTKLGLHEMRTGIYRPIYVCVHACVYMYICIFVYTYIGKNSDQYNNPSQCI